MITSNTIYQRFTIRFINDLSYTLPTQSPTYLGKAYNTTIL